MTAALLRSAELGEMPCPCCGNAVTLKTDKKGWAYVHCGAFRQDAQAGFFRCHFHAKWGLHDSRELVRAFKGDQPPANLNRAPNEPPEPAQLDTIKPKETTHESEPREPDARPAARTASGGGFLFGD